MQSMHDWVMAATTLLINVCCYTGTYRTNSAIVYFICKSMEKVQMQMLQCMHFMNFIILQ
jgi:hypothetical protein